MSTQPLTEPIINIDGLVSDLHILLSRYEYLRDNQYQDQLTTTTDSICLLLDSIDEYNYDPFNTDPLRLIVDELISLNDPKLADSLQRVKELIGDSDDHDNKDKSVPKPQKKLSRKTKHAINETHNVGEWFIRDTNSLETDNDGNPILQQQQQKRNIIPMQTGFESSLENSTNAMQKRRKRKKLMIIIVVNIIIFGALIIGLSVGLRHHHGDKKKNPTTTKPNQHHTTV